MYKIFYALLTILWICDIANFPQLEVLDTTYPINFWIWFFIWICLPSYKNVVKFDKDDK